MKGKVFGLFVVLALAVCGVAFAEDAYVIDQNSRYVSQRDHYLKVDLDDDISLGFIIKAGSWFSTSDLDSLSRGWDECDGAVYRTCTERRTAKGANSVVIMTRKLLEEIGQIKQDYRAGREAKNRNPDLIEHIRRSIDNTAKRESDHLIRDLARDFVDDVIWKNRRW